MAWDFETDPDYQKKLDWVAAFVDEEIEPLTQLGLGLAGPKSKTYQKCIRPLQQKVKDQRLWACHLTPDLGGQGYGQIKLALLNEKLGRVGLAPVVFGCQAPDTGNAEIIAHYGTPAQKDKYLWPLLNNEITSACHGRPPAPEGVPAGQRFVPLLPLAQGAAGRRGQVSRCRAGTPRGVESRAEGVDAL